MWNFRCISLASFQGWQLLHVSLMPLSYKGSCNVHQQFVQKAYLQYVANSVFLCNVWIVMSFAGELWCSCASDAGGQAWDEGVRAGGHISSPCISIWGLPPLLLHLHLCHWVQQLHPPLRPRICTQRQSVARWRRGPARHGRRIPFLWFRYHLFLPHQRKVHRISEVRL